MGKKNKIGSVVRIRQILKQWQKKVHNTDHVSDIPPRHMAVSIGENKRRYVVRAKHLNDPIFRRFLAEAEEEYGFSNVGLLAISCDESLFEEIIVVVTRSTSATLDDIQRCMHVGMKKNVEYLCKSQPLFKGVAKKHV